MRSVEMVANILASGHIGFHRAFNFSLEIREGSGYENGLQLPIRQKKKNSAWVELSHEKAFGIVTGTQY